MAVPSLSLKVTLSLFSTKQFVFSDTSRLYLGTSVSKV